MCDISLGQKIQVSKVLTCDTCLGCLASLGTDHAHKHCSIHFLGQRMKVVQEVNFPPVNGQFPVAPFRLICRSECLLSNESLQIAVISS